MEKYCVYVTYHATGKFYVGKAPTNRVLCGSYRGSGRILLDAFKKYSRDEWITEVVQTFPTEMEAYEAEASWVDNDLLQDPYCLNINRGGKGGCRRKQSTEERQRRGASISLAISSPEHRKKMSLVSKLSSARPEVQTVRSAHTKRLWDEHRGMMLKARENSYGEEWRQKLSVKAKTSRRAPFKVEVNGIIYDRQIDAARALGLRPYQLRKLPTFREIE